MHRTAARSRMPRVLIAAFLVVALLAAACSSDDSGSENADTTSSTAVAPDDRADAGPDDEETAADSPHPPPRNPFLADSDQAIGHSSAAQQDSTPIVGPDGEIETLTEADIAYEHIGSAHFGIAISGEYPDGQRVIWSNGGDRIVKLDPETFEVIAELPLPDKEQVSEAEADEVYQTIDSLDGQELIDYTLGVAANHLAGLAGVYYLLDADNTLFVGDSESVIAYTETDPDDPASDIEIRDEFFRPEGVTGQFVSANMTFDGKLIVITDEGWVLAIERDFSDHDAIQLPGAEDAPAHNQAMADEGRRKGSADWVRNPAAIDEDGGIYVPSVDQMHKVVWDGEKLSTDPADGAWSEPYLNGHGIGTGSGATLMGFGEEDEFVVITDGEPLMNVVLYWRDEIPEGWEPPEGAPSPRIAGMAPADVGDPDATAVQTEQSTIVSGYGAMVVNNEAATVPEGLPGAATRILVGYLGNRPEYTPYGVQKFVWDPETQDFGEAWVNTDVSSTNGVPVVSLGSDLVYTVGVRDGQWALEAIDWQTGESAFHWVLGGHRYNTRYSGLNVDQNGQIVYTTDFGIIRIDR